ncbi:acyclic terpene utilization AtuA family protein [Nocardia sp. 348MFTsu5.1]|uniref:acyclic terpene utilization AtuA family protein n=1 Tax=Nocardia sp. 348MFTsu5.1 TaxID=1172185 RepID=UPI00036D0667|nr:acyclic terpene utilization AtuA family protein [Nocardia sp. 348MFTsu5.1]
MSDVIRIGNASGFYGDRFSAMQEMLSGGDLDCLTGDYLAELTMLILGRDRLKDPKTGYAKTFLRQLEANLGTAMDAGVTIVSNAGGVNPAGLAAAIGELAEKLGMAPKIGYVDGDDLGGRAEDLGLGTPLTANAYLGGFGIAAALRAGADIVVTGRVTDASLTVGPAAAHFGWGPDDLDQLAGAVAAGHIIECGTQATGGNYSFFTEISDMGHLGFPIAEISAGGDAVITKHTGTGGAVTVGTVTAQLLYEIGGPRYLGPDVTTRMDSITLTDLGDDRVQISGVKGETPPDTLKVSLNHLAGFRNEVTMVLTGLDIDAKAELARRQFEAELTTRPADLTWTLTRLDHDDAPSEQQASALLQCVAKDLDQKVVGRQFSSAAVELALASYPGFTMTSPPGAGSPYAVFEAGYVPAHLVTHTVHLADGTTEVIESRVATDPVAPETVAEPHTPVPGTQWGPTRVAPLGEIAGARSGDKGGNANVGVWVRNREHFEWLAATLTTELFKQLIPEAENLEVHRHELPNLLAVNFVIDGILGRGVADNVRFDPQAKGLGEWLRSRHVAIPIRFGG